MINVIIRIVIDLEELVKGFVKFFSPMKGRAELSSVRFLYPRCRAVCEVFHPRGVWALHRRCEIFLPLVGMALAICNFHACKVFLPGGAYLSLYCPLDQVTMPNESCL